MFRRYLLAVLTTIFVTKATQSQSISYSEPDRDDARTVSFDIAGKIDNHILIVKNTATRSDYSISVFDTDMKLLDKVKLTFLPDRILSSDVLSYKNFFYLFYQYQRRNIIYCMAAKFNGDGKMMSDPVQLDTTAISYFSNNKIYTVINSEDKKKIAIFKINSRRDDNYKVTTVLFDESLNRIKKSELHIPMPDRNDFLTEFSVANNGTLIFARAAGTNQNQSISKITLITKKADDDSLSYASIDITKVYLDDIRIKINNANNRFLLISYYANERRGNIEGLFCSMWDLSNLKELYNTNATFSEDFRANAKSEGSTRAALNDFFLQDIVMRNDGGFVVVSESAYSSSRGGGYYNRWDYMYGSPYWTPADSYLYGSPYGYGYGFYPWGRPGYNMGQITRFYSDNIAVMSFDSSATLEWANIIPKSQYDDNTDNFIGYGTLNTGSEVHFLFNELEKRTLILNDQSISGDGKVTRNPTLHNLDRGYDFMPHYAKQVGSKELIVPCQYRNYVCFARIVFD
ncbi:MAG TPA: hypothetical protein VG738_08100 [Chitinophagaceae bacterium]|nr:hypothetical protein [Chitinophagaceae bacterium]